jgi:hypothetical protein
MWVQGILQVRDSCTIAGHGPLTHIPIVGIPPNWFTRRKMGFCIALSPWVPLMAAVFTAVGLPFW